MELNNSQKNYLIFNAFLSSIKGRREREVLAGATGTRTYWRVYRDRYKSGTLSVNVYGLSKEEIQFLAPLADDFSPAGRFQFYNLPLGFRKIARKKYPVDVKEAIKVLQVSFCLDRV